MHVEGVSFYSFFSPAKETKGCTHSQRDSYANSILLSLTFYSDHKPKFITARKHSLRMLCFYKCVSVHGEGGGIPACIAGGIPACLVGFQTHTQGGSWEDLARGAHPKGEVEGGLARGVSRPTPRGEGLQAHTQGSIPACTEADPPPQWLLLRAVRILLECILVFQYLWSGVYFPLLNASKIAISKYFGSQL